jgi:cytochrome c
MLQKSRTARYVVIAVVALVSRYASAQDASRGETVFSACAVCHAKDHSNRAGPGLGGIVGRTSGTAPGFHYSRAMKKSNMVWTEKTLDAYIAAPQQLVPGNTMPYSGLKNAQDRSDLIAFLKSLR